MTHDAIEYVDIHKIIARQQPRDHVEEDDNLLGLTNTIAEIGIQQPLRVRREGDQLVITDGHRRYKAAQKAGLPEVPVIIDDGFLTEAEVWQRSLICNCQRVDLTPLERARAFNRLMMEFGWTAAEVARRSGVSEATISKLTTLLTLPPAVITRIQEGHLAASTAYHIAITSDVELKARLCDEAVTDHLSRDGVAKRVRTQAASSTPPKPRRRLARVTLPMSGVSIAISAVEMTVEGLASIIERLLDRIRELPAKEIAVKDLRKALMAQAATNKQTAA